MTDSEHRRPTHTQESRRLSGTTRLLLISLGSVAFGAGTAAVFLTDGNGGAGGAALLVTGALAVTLGGVGVLPTNVKVGGVELTLPEQVQQLATEAARQGRPDVARALQVSAELAATAEPFTEVYESIRRIALSSSDRTTALDALVDIVEKGARDGRWSPDEARSLFASGHDGARIFALAMMRAFPRADDLDLAEQAAVQPRSAFEQLHALVVLQRALPRLSDERRVRLERQLRHLSLAPTGSGTGSRQRIRAEILDEIAALRQGPS